MWDSKVDTISRMAQWRIHNLPSSTHKQSDPFKIGIWNWHLSVEKSWGYLTILLFLEASSASKEQRPAAKYVLRLIHPQVNRVYEKVIQSTDKWDRFAWNVKANPEGYFVIDVEFHDLKIFSDTTGEVSSIWPNYSSWMRTQTSTLRCVSRMFLESIHADVTINTADGSLQAHKAILSTSSPVFNTIILHNLKEKNSSTIDLQDMSTDSCMALLGCLYGTIKPHDFLKHRLALLAASHMYDISDLKDYCEESLSEDINMENVIERLHEAWTYQLYKLKKECFKYLFHFGKIFYLDKEEMSKFIRQKADIELMLESFQQLYDPDYQAILDHRPLDRRDVNRLIPLGSGLVQSSCWTYRFGLYGFIIIIIIGIGLALTLNFGLSSGELND